MDKMNQTLKIIIDFERCKGCEYCCSICPKQIIQLSKDYNSKGHHYAVIENDDKCSGCKFCAILCPEIAIAVS